MLVTIESMLTLVIRMSQLYDKEISTLGQIGRVKAYCTAAAREVIQTAREIFGGNGIILDNKVIKSLMDIEAVHTFEGTYDINMLISGREITGGLSAFKR